MEKDTLISKNVKKKSRKIMSTYLCPLRLVRHCDIPRNLDLTHPCTKYQIKQKKKKLSN